MHILLVEDNREVAEMIFEYLEAENVVLDYAATGTQGLELGLSRSFDCIVLDVMLPGLDGVSVCQQLREAGNNTPIIMLTARDTSQDMLLGLNNGADDYIVKPFELELLLARIQAVVRRSSGAGFKKVLEVGALSIELSTRRVTRSGVELTLNPSCYSILKLLMESYPNITQRHQIEQALWQDELPEQDVLRKHIYQLRSKVDKPFDNEIIVTAPKLGYKLVSDNDK